MEYWYCLNGKEAPRLSEEEIPWVPNAKGKLILSASGAQEEENKNNQTKFDLFLYRIKSDTKEKFYYVPYEKKCWRKEEKKYTQHQFVAAIMCFMLGIGNLKNEINDIRDMEGKPLSTEIEKQNWDKLNLRSDKDAGKTEWFPYCFKQYIFKNYPDREKVDWGKYREQGLKDQKVETDEGLTLPIFYLNKKGNKEALLKEFIKRCKGENEENSPKINWNDWEKGYTYYIGYLEDKKETEENPKMSDQGNEMNKKIDSIVKENIKNYHQIIFTGAPGTGKTYTVRENVKEERHEFVQFHPSYDYSDFVEGLRPVQLEKGELSFVRLDGIFKKFCREIVMENLKKIAKKRGEAENETKKLLEAAYHYYQCKQYRENEYSPEDIEAFAKDFDSIDTEYYFVIDEINRADLSKVLGELLFGLEESYRGIQHWFNTQYQNLPTYQVNEDGKAEPMEFDCFKNGFFIPRNLKIIGTMNDIDRSVETFDFALRRRFAWIEIKANEIMESSLEDMLGTMVDKKDIKDLAQHICNMNEEISGQQGCSFTDAYHIGPAYFKDYDGTPEKLKEIFHTKIEPLLREYTRQRKPDLVDNLIEKCRKKLLKEGSKDNKENENAN